MFYTGEIDLDRCLNGWVTGEIEKESNPDNLTRCLDGWATVKHVFTVDPHSIRIRSLPERMILLGLAQQALEHD